MMGINQVIMMALALVVLACFIGAEGIGGQVWQAIRRLDVGWAMEGGLCILFMAIMFDRFSMSFSKTEQSLPSNVQKFYLLPQSWEKYLIARVIEKPLEFLSGLTNFVCINLTRSIAYVFEFCISLSNKNTARDIGEAITRRYYIIPSFFLVLAISFVDSYLISIGSFLKSGDCQLDNQFPMP